jgi:hypothetical protein
MKDKRQQLLSRSANSKFLFRRSTQRALVIMSEFAGKGVPSSSSTGAGELGGGKLSWDPDLCMTNRQPSRECLQRIRLDLKALAKDPLPGIYCTPDETYNT